LVPAPEERASQPIGVTDDFVRMPALHTQAAL
jgi:hypothetical protein